MKTEFQKYIATRKTQDPGFADRFESEKKRIQQIDDLIFALDAERQARGLSKVELAKRAELQGTYVRRIFTQENPNPTLENLVALANALGKRIELVDA